MSINEANETEQEPVFLDFDASGLDKRSYPIEVVWSNMDGSIESYLIRPEAS